MKSKSFEELGVSVPLVRVLNKLQIVEPTEIQEKVIPLASNGRDVLASAETGSGKTAAFLLPIIGRLGKSTGRTRALVLAPTRELAIQIESNARVYGQPSRLRSVAVVGGQNIARQVRALGAGVDILVATPGRLNDLLQRNQVSLNSVEVLVLDEADRMLDMGFLPQVRRIVEHLPRKRQTLLLSATVSRGVEKLAREMMSEPVRVEVGRKATTVATLFQSAYSVLAHAKTPLLLRLLDHHRDGSFLVFTETRRGAERVAQVLAANRHRVDAIHADRSQSQRNRALAGFKDGRLKVLVATNVAARGIDIDDVSHVINYDVPSTIEDYLHRVGRTARAGREGSALTLVSPAEESAFAEIERAAGISITRARLEGFSDGRTEQQTRLATEIGRLRGSHSRSFSPRRASR
jgi:ATP-dependent RNA helicase RhlE